MSIDPVSYTHLDVYKRQAVIPMISAASLALSALFQRMEAQPSGEITE